MLSRALLRPGDTEADLALRLADFAEAVLPVIDPLTGSVLRTSTGSARRALTGCALRTLTRAVRRALTGARC